VSLIYTNTFGPNQALCLKDNAIALGGGLYNKKSFNQRLWHWWIGGEYCLKRVIEQVRKDLEGVLQKGFREQETALNNLTLLQKKVVKHNSRWDVYLLSFFTSRVLCPDLSDKIKEIKNGPLKVDLAQRNSQHLIKHLVRNIDLSTEGILQKGGGEVLHNLRVQMDSEPYTVIPIDCGLNLIFQLLQERIEIIKPLNKEKSTLLSCMRQYRNDDATLKGLIKLALSNNELLQSLFPLLKKITDMPVHGVNASQLGSIMAPYLCDGDREGVNELAAYIIEHSNELF
jgi:hypothetical protein